MSDSEEQILGSGAIDNITFNPIITNHHSGEHKFQNMNMTMPMAPLVYSDMSHEKMGSKLSQQIESYSSFEVMSALMFGFAVAVMFDSEGDKKLYIFSEDRYYALEIIFSLLMSIVLLANMYTMIVMSLTHFYVIRFVAVDNYQSAQKYLQLHAIRRRYARNAFYIALFMFLCAIGIYLYPLLRLGSTIIMFTTLLVGGAIICHTLRSMINPEKLDMREVKNDISEMIGVTDPVIELE